jgi:hypothetical protein
MSRWSFYSVLALGLLTGGLGFGAVWLSVFEEKFMRINKLFFGLFFLSHAVIYFIFDPEFNQNYTMYWFMFAVFTSMVMMSFGFEKSARAVTWWEKLHHKIGWSGKGKKYMLSK